MNAAERLQAIIKARLEGEAFGWGPILAVWAGITALRMGLEVILGGPSPVVGAGAYLSILVFQVGWARSSWAFPGARDWTLQGLWGLVAPAAWFLGSMAPAAGLFSAHAGSVLETLFLGGGLTQTGLLKSRRALWVGGLGLITWAVVLGAVPALLPLSGLAVALGFGLPALLQKK